MTEADDADATKRLWVAITHTVMNDLTQTEAAALYGFSSSWTPKWFNRLERLVTELFEKVVYDKPREGRPAEFFDDE